MTKKIGSAEQAKYLIDIYVKEGHRNLSKKCERILNTNDKECEILVGSLKKGKFAISEKRRLRNLFSKDFLNYFDAGDALQKRAKWLSDQIRNGDLTKPDRKLIENIYTLGKISPAEKDSVQALMKALKSENKEVQIAARYSLGRIGPVAIPALRKALGSEKRHERMNSAYALGMMKDKASPAIPDLEKLFSDAEKEVCKEAAFALGRIGEKALPALKRALKSKNHDLQMAAAIALRRMGSKASGAVDDLCVTLLNGGISARYASVKALDAIGVYNENVISALKKATKDTNEYVRNAATDILKKAKLKSNL